MTERIFFNSEDLELEGLLNTISNDKAAVISHPHPQFGGSMHNNVVDSIAGAYSGKGWTTLKFNFRGTGASHGRFCGGYGEAEDVRSAVSYLKGLGFKKICLAGYSFGAWVNALACSSGLEVSSIVMVSPPVGLLDFSTVTAMPGLGLVICGAMDEFAPPETVEAAVKKWNSTARIEVIDRADHFYFGFEKKIEAILDSYIA